MPVKLDGNRAETSGCAPTVSRKSSTAIGQQGVQVLASAWGGCAAEQGFGLEHPLAQGVVGVFGGGGVWPLAGGGAVQAAFAVVVAAGQAVTEQVACAVVLVGDAGAGGVAACAGGGAGHVAGAGLAVAVGVVLEGGGVGSVGCRGSGEAGDAAGGAVLHGPAGGGLGELVSSRPRRRPRRSQIATTCKSSSSPRCCLMRSPGMGRFRRPM